MAGQRGRFHLLNQLPHDSRGCSREMVTKKRGRKMERMMMIWKRMDGTQRWRMENSERKRAITQNDDDDDTVTTEEGPHDALEEGAEEGQEEESVGLCISPRGSGSFGISNMKLSSSSESLRSNRAPVDEEARADCESVCVGEERF